MGPGVLKLISEGNHLLWVSRVEVDGSSTWAGGSGADEIRGGLTHDLRSKHGGEDIGTSLTVGESNSWDGTIRAKLLEVGARETQEDSLLGAGAGFPVNIADTASAEGGIGGSNSGDESEVLEHLVNLINNYNKKHVK